MKEELKKLGLTEGESKVYLSLLKIGLSSVGPIVKESKVSYSKVYMVLNRLLDKGLITFIIKDKTKYFQAVKPVRILDYLEKKQKELEERIGLFHKILPDIEKIEQASLKKEEAEIFIGFSGLRTAYETLLKDSEIKEPLLFFYVYDISSVKIANLFYKQEFHYYKKLKIKLKGITTLDFKRSEDFKKPPSFIELRWVDFPLPSTIDIYKDGVLFISWGQKIVSYLINSNEIAENYKKYFYKIWDIAKK